jgi:hypothetical protein
VIANPGLALRLRPGQAIADLQFGHPMPRLRRTILQLPLVDGCRLDAGRRVGSAYIFPLPAAASCVRVVSRAAAPAELGLARDPRILGIALRRAVVRAGARFRIVATTDDRLAEGFHGDALLRICNDCANDGPAPDHPLQG